MTPIYRLLTITWSQNSKKIHTVRFPALILRLPHPVSLFLELDLNLIQLIEPMIQGPTVIGVPVSGHCR
jgi:hypothetical protein